MINDFEIDKKILVPFANGMRPVERVSVSNWADKNRFLTSVSSAEPGRYRTDRMPYMREIQDRLGKTDPCTDIAVMKGAQLGFSEIGLNWLGYLIDVWPSTIMVAMPTDEAVKKTSRTRFRPMIDACPALKDKIKAVGSKDAENTINSKSFPGGVIMFIGATSPVGLSSTPAGKVFADEVDRWPMSAGDEGSPLSLLRARARTFSNRKFYVISTPTNEGESVIADEFFDGDQRYYFVPCIHCGEKFILKFEHFTYDESNPETTKLACPECGGLHEEKDKTTMLEGGEWIPTAKSNNPRKYSYHLSSLYSPAGFYSWSDLIRDYLKVKNDVNKYRTFVNTVLGETFKIKGEAPDSENLYNRRENYEIGSIPEGVYFLTMGVDIQGDRIEGEVVGWGKGRESWSIEYFVFVGDTSKHEVWEQLKNQINKQYDCGNGSMLTINLTCVDAGYKTSTVYDFVTKFSYSKVVPIMGRDSVKDVMVSPPRIYNTTKSGKKITSRKIWYLGTGLLKSEIYGFLKLKPLEVDGVETYPEGYCHFPQYDRHYFNMLTAEEQQQIVNKKGYNEYQWVKKSGARNEALDVRNYARAAAYIVGIDRFKDDTWEKIKMQSSIEIVEKTEKPQVRQKEIKKKSSYW